MTIEFASVVQVPMYPGCWFYSPELSVASSTSDYTVWKPGELPSWATLFGPKGSLLFQTGALYAVDGITTTITSDASINGLDRKTFEAAAKLGIFPFFSASGSGGTTTNVEWGQSAGITIKTTTVPGTPRIIGRTVLPIQRVAAMHASLYSASALPMLYPSAAFAASSESSTSSAPSAFSFVPPAVTTPSPQADVDAVRALAARTSSDVLKYGLHKVAHDYDERRHFVESVGDSLDSALCHTGTTGVGGYVGAIGAASAASAAGGSLSFARAEKMNCYFHHNCPNDGILSDGPFSKIGCKRGGGKSWGDGPRGSRGATCENVD